MAGRPRDPELERRLLAATWALLEDGGYDAVTPSRVAQRAGAHRSDVYRRWPTTARLVTAALSRHLPPVAGADTGALWTDLRAFVDDLAAVWASRAANGLVGLLSDLRSDAEAEAAFRTMTAHRDQPLVDALARAVHRGEIGEVPDPALLGNLLEGPLMHRSTFGRTPLSADDLDVITGSAYALLTGSGVRR